MAYVVPLNNSPNRTVTVPFDDIVLNFRSYWSGSVEGVWKIDVSDADHSSILSGVVLAGGIDDLFNGSGYTPLSGYSFRMFYSKDFNKTTSSSLGVTEKLVVITPDDTDDDIAAVEDAVYNGTD